MTKKRYMTFTKYYDDSNVDHILNEQASKGWVLKSATSVGQSNSKVHYIMEKDLESEEDDNSYKPHRL